MMRLTWLASASLLLHAACTPPDAWLKAHDGDGDSYVDSDYGGDDCNDADATVNPAVSEEPLDGIDQDCDGTEECYRDDDGDGFGTSYLDRFVALDCHGAGAADNPDDCDDTRADVNPGAEEVSACPADDYDCDGSPNMDFSECYDSDDDGYPDGEDCNDYDENAHPGAAEECGNFADDNCSGQEDEGCDYTTVGCVGSASSSVAEGVEWALRAGLLSAHVCAGTYVETENVLLTAGFELTTETSSGGVIIESMAQYALDVEPDSGGPVRVGALSVRCQSGRTGVVVAPWDEGSATFDGLSVSGCGTGLSLWSGVTVSVGEDAGGTFESNVLAVSVQPAVVGSFSNLEFSQNGDVGAVWVNVGSYDWPVALRFEDCEFRNNFTSTGGSVLLMNSNSEASADVYFEDCTISENESNTNAMSGGSGAIFLYYHDREEPTVTFDGGHITDNVALLGDGAGALHMYSGTVHSYGVDWGSGSTDNSPHDIGGISDTSNQNYGSSATFDCVTDETDLAVTCD